MENTDVLVLNKTPYRETSLLVCSISPDDGRFDFVLKGGQGPDKHRFPAIDLFREVRVEFQPQVDVNRMPTVYQVEPLDSFDAIAGNPARFVLACELAKFALDNTSPGLPCPELYGALKHQFAVFCGYVDRELSADQCRLLLRLACLNENGLLPDSFFADPRQDELQHRLIAALLEAAQGEMPLPRLSDVYWRQLAGWTAQLCTYHGLTLETPPTT